MGAGLMEQRRCSARPCLRRMVSPMRTLALMGPRPANTGRNPGSEGARRPSESPFWVCEQVIDGCYRAIRGSRSIIRRIEQQILRGSS